MRTLTDHTVAGDKASQLKIDVLDEPGQGGANHLYRITGFNIGANASCVNTTPQEDAALVLFQNGPIREFGVNGVTQEALLAIVIDRLRSFQAGPFSCRENALALTYCEQALMWLQSRTNQRIRRGVEGTNAA